MPGFLHFIRPLIRLLRNKYLVATLFFVVWVALFDANNLIDRFKQVRELKQLEADKEYYLKKIEEDSRKLKELETDEKSLEKYAREQYLMKRPDEDLYIIIEK